jgi:hypothetical protein
MVDAHSIQKSGKLAEIADPGLPRGLTAQANKKILGACILKTRG